MRILFTIFLIHSTTFSIGQIMSNTFYKWDDFVANFGKEMVIAEDVYNSMKKNGLQDFTYSRFDYHFISDKKPNLDRLQKFLTEHYNYEFKEFTTSDDLYEVRGLTIEIPITKDNLLYWALDMAKRGVEFDCLFEGYGSAPDNDNPRFPDFSKDKQDHYFNQAFELYNHHNLSGAIINWTIVLKINPEDPDSYYSRAIVKNELYTWKSALQDYDRAIELAPDFIGALINRGTVKDENQDYHGAIEDYNKAIELDGNSSMAYLNRGNTKFSIGDKRGACEDWKKAEQLGDEAAAERVMANCE